MSVVRDIIKSDIFVLAVAPLLIAFGILYVCKLYKFSIIPKSLKLKKKGKFKMPTLNRREMDKSLGRAGKYEWSLENDDVKPPPVYISESRVTPRKNMYS